MTRNLLISILFCGSVCMASAEDGSRLWLRQDTTASATVDCMLQSPTLDIARNEISRAWRGKPVSLQLFSDPAHEALGKEGYTIRTENGRITLGSVSETGLLYAAYHLLRLQATEADMTRLDIREKPVYDLRILNHWDNPDGTVERGYAGHSLWKWEELPDRISPRYEAYARANASIGINGTVINNVNASPQALSTENLNRFHQTDITPSFCMSAAAQIRPTAADIFPAFCKEARQY